MVIDIAIVLIILAFLFLGYIRGMIKVAFKFASLILAIILAIILHDPVSNFIINHTSIDEKIESTISENIKITKQDTSEGEKIVIEEANLPEVIMNNIKDSARTTVNNVVEDAQTQVAKQLSKAIINLFILLVIFIVVKIALDVIAKILDLISKLPVIHQFDKIGGIIIGALEGIVIVYILLAICLTISPFIQSNDLLQMINSSNIGKIMYNDNILLKFIG